MHYHELQQSNVELWAQVLDWVPPNMHNVEEFYKLLQPMLQGAFFEHFHCTLGSLSQVIPGCQIISIIPETNYKHQQSTTILGYIIKNECTAAAWLLH